MAPAMGPVMVPKPPITTIISAQIVQFMPTMPVGSKLSCIRANAPPARPVSVPLSSRAPARIRQVLTPRVAAAPSCSRIASRRSPNRLPRTSTATPMPRAPTTTPSWYSPPSPGMPATGRLSPVEPPAKFQLSSQACRASAAASVPTAK